MKKLLMLALLSGCSAVSPSTKIFEVAQGTDSKGNPKAVSLKVFDTQADFLGDTEIQTKHFTLIAKGGINHSTAVHEHWKGIHDTSTGIIQPFILAPVGGSVLKAGMGLIPH
jgi:hypothetical protein